MNKKLLSRPLGRCIGLDVHLDFIQIAICEEGKVFSAGRVPSTPEGIKTLTESLMSSDRVALEVTGSSREIARLLAPHVKRVIVVSPADTGISQARAKTDRLDARTLAKLLWTGELEAVWMPPEWIARMRRRLARREQLVRARSRVKNELQGVLMRQLKGRPPASDLFGVKGRAWLRGVELPEEEDETVKAGLRHIEFLDGEIEQVERLIANEALQSPQVKRLLTVPGVNVICAAIFLAAVGDIRRFKGSRKVVAYLGLDPRVYQSGSAPARRADLKARLAQGALGAGRGQPLCRPATQTHARLLRADQGPQRPQRGGRHGRAQARGAVLPDAHPRRGPRPPAALADRAEATAASRSPPAPPPARASPPACGPHASECGTPRNSSPNKPRPPTSARSPTGGQRRHQQEGSRRERDTGARIVKGLEGQSRAAGPASSRRLLFDPSSTRAQLTT